MGKKAIVTGAIFKICVGCNTKFEVPNIKRGRNRLYCSKACSASFNGLANRGKKRTEEFKNKHREIFAGDKNPFYGKHHSQKTKDLLSKLNKGKQQHLAIHDIPIVDRIKENIVIDSNGCWIWQGWLRVSGKKGDYGGFKLLGKPWLVHRLSYKTFKGEIPKGMLVCHTCDITKCVNPNHLFIGTQDDNMKDMAKKKRGTIGIRSHCKLSKNDVKEIREFSKTQSLTCIAKKYNVTQQNIKHIVNFRTWKNI